MQTNIERAISLGLYPQWPAWCLRFGKFTLQDLNLQVQSLAQWKRRRPIVGDCR